MGNLTFLYPLVLLCKAAWWKKKVLIHLLRKGITIKSQFYPILQDLGLKKWHKNDISLPDYGLSGKSDIMHVKLGVEIALFGIQVLV